MRSNATLQRMTLLLGAFTTIATACATTETREIESERSEFQRSASQRGTPSAVFGSRCQWGTFHENLAEKHYIMRLAPLTLAKINGMPIHYRALTRSRTMISVIQDNENFRPRPRKLAGKCSVRSLTANRCRS